MALSPRRALAVKAVSIVGVVVAVVALAVVSSGYDAQKVDRFDPSVWVTRSAGQYARVDTNLAQIDTVRDAEDPTAVVQSGSSSVVYTGGYRQMWPLDAANPRPLIATDADAAAGTTPAGTRQVVASGDWTAYLTDTGRVFIADLASPAPAGTAPVPMQIDPLDTETPDPAAPGYEASALAVADDGAVVLYSAAERAIRRYDATTSRFVDGATAVPAPPAADTRVLLTIVNGRWVLAAPGEGRVWVQGGRDPVAIDLGADLVAQRGAADGDRAYFADSAGLVAVRLGDGAAERVPGGGTGTPAAPTRVDGMMYAAWLSPGGGTLWSSDGGPKALEIPDGRLDQAQDIAPVIATNGRRAVLNETRTGLLWTIPDGAVIPLSQWNADDEQEKRQQGAVQVQDVAQQEPPVAEPDAFGVRAGALVALPVLLNDHDPNRKDVLTVDRTSIGVGTGDPGFARLSLANDDQQILARVQAVGGSTTFGYAVTDGQATSPPATVTLDVVPDDVNSAPVWCGTAGCLQEWPTVAIAPGGTVTVPILDGWVDPESDPIALASAAADDPAAPITVLPTADGKVAIRHTDPNAAGATFSITVTVTDSRGARATKQLTVSVSADPPIEVEPIVVVAGVGQERTVAIADHVRGGSGSFRLVDAQSSGSQTGVSIVPNIAAGTITVAGRAPGEYSIGFTVQDAVTEATQTGTLRLSTSPNANDIAIPPLTAFVRANEDTTLDILAAVQSTSGRVLALASATTSDPGLSVSVIEGSRLRLSGTTADGRPGTVGTAAVTVTDSAGATANGTVTVFLVASATGVGPIALPDAVTVRAGTQVDVDVTANDIAPRGERIVVHPRLEGSGAAGELAFVAGSSVRYLAPSEPGVYTLRYSVFLEGDPSRLDSAPITVTVLAGGENHAPEPRALVARVAAGSSVTIPVPGGGMDPDGDATALVGVEQPRAGSGAVTISADGESLVYAAPANGVADGQVGFGYTIRDAQGAEGVGSVHVGVLDGAIADVAPVTYSDGVRAVAGAAEPLTVHPLSNDRDPALGVLELVSVVPNAVEGSPEAERLRGLLDPGTDLADGVVKVRAGAIEGVHSYVYTVRSAATSSTAQGLIVVTVASQAAPDQPVVADTVVTIADRTHLESGIDVVSGKATWASGDIGSLTLAVWGDAASRYRVVGRQISGPAPADGALVPFSLSGRDAAGSPVVAYGFLRIPAFDHMRLQLNPDLDPYRVAEEASVVIAGTDAAQVGDGDRLEVRSGDAFAVQRANASCVPTGPTSATYSAGREAPWTDSCTIAVRVAGQTTWTLLPVPVAIEPRSPQAALGSISRTVAPGASQTIDLYRELTTWEGGRVGDRSQLDYRVAFSGSDFIVEQTGPTVTVTARADARPGARQSANITVSAFGGLQSTLSLVVGAAPADTPRGATFARSCTVSASASCTIPVIGGPGEYDPFAGKAGAGLRLGGLGEVACAIARLSVTGGNAITATWPAGARPAGGSCTVPFTVADAQGRTGGGTLTLDVQGYPAPPRSVTTSSYTGSSVTLLVSLGEASNAHPSLSGVVITEGGSRVDASCVPASGSTYACTVPNLRNGERHSFAARAVNDVGESLDSTAVATWAYRAPQVESVSATPTGLSGTSRSMGGALVRIEAGDDVGELRVQADTGQSETVRYRGRVTEVEMLLPVGVRTVRVVPVSQFQPPVGGGNAGDQQSASVQVAGLPYFDSDGTLTATSNTSLRLSGVDANANSSAKGTSIGYAVWREGRPEPRCAVDRNGDLDRGDWQAGTEFAGLDEYQEYSAAACVTNGYGVTKSTTVSAYTFADAPPGPTGLSYRVDPRPVIDLVRMRATWERFTAPRPPSTPSGFELQYLMNGGTSSGFSLSADRSPGMVKARYCWTRGSNACGSESTVVAETSPTTVTASLKTTTCTASPSASDVVFSDAVGSAASVAVTTNPDTATATYRITFTGEYGGLEPAELTRCTAPPST